MKNSFRTDQNKRQISGRKQGTYSDPKAPNSQGLKIRQKKSSKKLVKKSVKKIRKIHQNKSSKKSSKKLVKKWGNL